MAESNQLQKWRLEFENLRQTLLKTRDEIEARFEEAAFIEAKITVETDEIRECVADIKRDKQRCSEIYRQIPDPKEFSAEELTKRNGKAATLLDMAGEISDMERYLPGKVQKLDYMLEHQVLS